MTHVQAVRDTLLATAQMGAVVNAPFASTEPDAAVRQLVACIDRTVLERRLQVTLCDATEITMDVRNRRVLQVSVTLSSDPGTDAGEGLATPFSAKDAAGVGQQFRSVLQGKSIVRQRIIDDPGLVFPSTLGLSAAALLDGLDLRADPGAEIDLEALLTGLIATAQAKVLGACVLTSEGILVLEGSDEQVLVMVDWARPVVGDASPDSTAASCRFQTGGLCVLTWGGPDPSQLLIVNGSQEQGLVLIETDESGAFLAALRAQLAPPA